MTPSRSNVDPESPAAEREWLEGLRYEDKFPEVCAGCGDVDPEHWREGGWYCEGCASCPQCDSPYCEDPSHD